MEAVTEAWRQLAPAAVQAFLGWGKLYSVLLAGALLYWLVPWRAAREWLLVVGGFAFAYLALDPLGAFLLVLLALAVHGLVRSRAAASRLAVVVATGLLVGGYWWLLLGGLRQVAVTHLPPDLLSRLFALRPPSGLLGLNVITYLAYFMPVRMVHVLWDVHLKKAQAGSLRGFLAYCLFIPCLPCSPFMTYQDFSQQSAQAVRPGPRQVGYGLYRMGLGVVRLMGAAAVMMCYSSKAFVTPLGFSPAELWRAAIGFYLGLYLVLSFYADLARGYGMLLGIRVPENFDRPLWSPNMLEFWRRWNIAMIAWFRRYLYFPLGGSRQGELRTSLNYGAVMLACALWHGLTPPFVLWGLIQGACLAVTRLWQRLVPLKLGPVAGRLVLVLSTVCTFAYFSITLAMLQSAIMHQPLGTMLEVAMRLLALG